MNPIHMANCAICGEDVDTRMAVQLPSNGAPGKAYRHIDCGDGVLARVDNERDGTAVIIFDRAVIDSAKPFGVRYLDTDAKETLAVLFCPTLELAQDWLKEWTKCNHL